MMLSTWIDILFLVITAAALIFGLVRGLIREIVGILAVLAGFFLAAHYYPNISRLLSGVIRGGPVRDFLAFGAVFVVIVAAGGLLSRFISRRMAGLSRFFNHLLGGALGFLKGAFLCGVIVLAFAVFPADTEFLRESNLAPVALRVTRGLVQLAPAELKKRFMDSYQRMIEIKRGGDDGKKI
ncbi:MAG: CvpA family protein [Candidatus Aminicenantes bacterium]|nr:CvpA family protein [Candidatus Aminicenantes bacterium]